MIRRATALSFLTFASFAVSALPAFAQTKPKTVVPVESRPEAKAIVDQLLRQGKIIRASSVRRGMRGVARSVFQGTKIEEFQVVVLGVLGRVQGGSDLVLIKVLDGPVVKRQSGIIAGMSGSPVYINGKMLGAIAIGWGFPKEPIGGVTPITDMIQNALPDPTAARPAANTARKNAAGPLPASAYIPREAFNIGGKRIARVEVSRSSKVPALRLAANGDSVATMRPVSTLLQLSGWSEKSLPRMQRMFEPYQITPMIGPASKKTGVKAGLAPGAAIGVQLVSGDMDQTAVGTVTFRWGNRLLAFGHPMFGMGAVSLPITTSYIHDIFPSYQRSFKLSSPIAQMGALQQDTQYAIGGTIGAQPDMIPMTISLRDSERRIARTYRVRVMKDPALTPQLMGSVASEAIETALGQTSDKMVRVGLRMKVDGAEDIIRHNLLYSREAVTDAALFDFVQSLNISQQNEFARGSVSRVDLDVSLEPVRRTARIKSLFADRNKVKAGDTVRISVVLEPTGEPEKEQTSVFSFTVPADAPTGPMRIVATPGAGYWGGQVRVGAAPPDPRNLKELVAAWNKVGPMNVLTVQASTPETYVLIDRKKIPSPPPSMRKLLSGTTSSSVGAYNETQVRQTTTSYSLNGAQFLSIPVESRRDDDQAATPAVEEKPETKDVTAEIKVLTPAGDDAAADGPVGDEGDGGDGNSFLGKPLFLNQLKAWRASKGGFGTPKADALQTAPGRAPIDRPVAPSTTSPTPTPTPTATPAPTPTPTPAPSVLPVDDGKGAARPSLRWVQGSAPDFLRGRFEGAAVSSEGVIRAAPASRLLATTPEPFGWSIAGDAKGNVYLGTGTSARILKIDNAGTVSTFYEGAGVAVSALTTDAAGNVYAGFTPGGDVMRFAPNGRGSRILIGSSAAIWDLEWSPDGALLAASGGEANDSSAIYRIADAANATESAGSLFVRLPQKHIRALAARGQDIFAATAEDGVLYRIDLAGKATALYQTAGTTRQPGEITSVAVAPEGVYFGTLASGTIYRWDEKNGAVPYYASPQTSVYAIRRGENGTIYAATGDKGIVYAITSALNPSDARGARVLEPKQLQATALNLAADGDLLIATSNNAAAYRVTVNGKDGGTYTSAIFDAANAVTWGALRTDGGAWETRSGNTAEPDASWSQWQASVSNDLGERHIASPTARYLQMRARIAPNETIGRVEAIYRASNTAPVVTWVSPRGGEAWRAKKTISWSGKDANSDALRYRLWLSNDGAAWKPVTLKDSDETTTELDTTQWPDGTYRAKVEASDAARNPDDPQTDEAISPAFVIDNAAPRSQSAGALKQPNGDWQLEATILDELSPLTSAEWRFAPVKPEPKAVVKAAAVPPAATTAAIPPATKAVAAKPGETKAAAAKITDAKTADAKPADVKPAEVKPAEAKPADTKPVEAKPAEVKTLDAAAKDEDPGNEWNAMTARDGIFDSRRETAIAIASASAVATAAKARGGTASIEIRARDAAGNVVTVTVTAS